jgi:CubicO group peptidase (beta-lactamase class C family)
MARRLGASTFRPLVPLALLLAAGCAATPPPPASDGVIGSSSVRAPEHPVEPAGPDFPGAHWEPIVSPESVGYSTAKIEMVRALLEDLDTTAAMVVVHGRVLFQYGDVARVSYVASIRKSILGMLFGEHVARGEIVEQSTLAQLGIDDVGGLTAEEKQATIGDLLGSRSGVYHPAANRGDDSKDAPPRGSKRPGNLFLYNNWDFNALGTIFEQQTHEGIYDALERELAKPIGMEDFKLAEQHPERNDAVSIHPAYHMYLSTRDLARIGYLMLRRGSWDGHELVPPAWIAEMLTPTVGPDDTGEYVRGMRYGKLWWVFDEPRSHASGPLEGAYGAMGAYGQYLTVIPKLDMVVVHKVVHKEKEKVDPSAYRILLDLVVACRGSGLSAGGPAPPAPLSAAGAP